jgi:tRNA 2-thiouridine synthesizing protein A
MADDELDVLGLKCPLPVMALRRRLAGMPSGAVLRVLADDPVSVIDIPNACREDGHDLLAAEGLAKEGLAKEGLAGGGMAFLVRKG